MVEIAPDASDASAVGLHGGTDAALRAGNAPVGLVTLPCEEFPRATCAWGGSSGRVIVWLTSPPAAPSVREESPGPWPQCSGLRPLRSGRRNVVVPSPPYVMPRSEKRVRFWAIERNCPLHMAQPWGAKSNGTSMMS